MRVSKYYNVNAKIIADTSAVAIYARELCCGVLYLTSDAPIHGMTAVSTQTLHICNASSIPTESAKEVAEFAKQHGVLLALHENVEAESLTPEYGPQYMWDSITNRWREGVVK